MKKEQPFPIYEFKLLPNDLDFTDKNEPVLRYAEGKWLPAKPNDYDLAFIGPSAHKGVCGFPNCVYVDVPYHTTLLWSWDGGNWSGFELRHKKSQGNAWHYMTKDNKDLSWDTTSWSERDQHPNELAGRRGMDKECDRCGCSNGHGPEFHINDPYILAGLVRVQETKEVVTFPKKFICIYCGDISKEVQRALKKCS